MNSERQPRNIDIVRVEILKDSPTPRHLLPEATGLNRRQISTAFSYLVRKGEIPRSTASDSREIMRAAVSNARGGLALTIEPYIKTGLKPSEIQFKLLEDQGVEVDIEKIRRSVSRVKASIKKSSEIEKGKPNRIPKEAIEARRIREEEIAKRAENKRIAKDANDSRKKKRIEKAVEAKKVREENNANKARNKQEEATGRAIVKEETVAIIANELNLPLASRGFSMEQIQMILLNGKENTNNVDPHVRNCRIIAKKFIDGNIIVEDTTYWDFAKCVADKQARNWFQDPAYGLVVEGWMIASYFELNGNANLKNSIEKLCDKVDPEWFNSRIVQEDLELASTELVKQIESAAK
jgi:hypothetical protein